MTQIRPILSTLRRHKTAAALIVLEIALTFAIVCNAVFVIANRVAHVRQPSGLDESALVYLGTHSIGRGENVEATTRADLAALRAVPGVQAATIVGYLPFGHEAQNDGLNLDPDQPTPTATVSTYNLDAGALGVLGLHLVAGRDFRPDEVIDDRVFESSDEADLPSVIVTRVVAERLFPGRDAVGRDVYIYGKHPTRIVGVVDRLVRPHPDQGEPEDGFAIAVPVRPNYNHGTYLLRTTPEGRDAVLKAAEAVLEADPRRVAQDHGTFADARSDYYRGDRQMVWLLASVCAAMLVVTAFGIVGLASFWVQQRTRMIGTRRALGATRGAILRYFQVENALLTTAGIVLGMLGAYGINQWLMTQYELPRLPALWLPLGAIALWALGQLAVLAHARRASRVPPALAMRA